MSFRGKNSNKKKYERESKESNLEEFPEDLNDVLFHNMTIESLKRLRNLRGLVYKKIKTDIEGRIAHYNIKNIPLNDVINIEFNFKEYSLFEWGIIREELMESGIKAEFYPVINEVNNEEGKEGKEENEEKGKKESNIYKKLKVIIERNLTLTGVNKNFREASSDEEESEEESD
jgi:hypothetical protein